jgi:hypothetical protein
MQRATFTLQVLTLGLAIAATACRSTTAHAQSTPVPVADPLAVEPAEVQSSPPATTTTPPASERNANDPHAASQNASTTPPTHSKSVEVAAVKAKAAAARQNLAYDAYGRAMNAFGMARGMSPAGAAAEAVAVVSTEPMDAATGAEWREDLVVMDKLLRDASSGAAAAAGDPQRIVLGLAIKNSGNRVPPTYVEGAGVVLTTSAGFPLAPDANATTRPDRPHQPPSAWDRAKREINGGGGGGGDGRGRGSDLDRARWLVDGGELGVDEDWHVQFDQALVDALVDSIVKVLPEATNFRHLKDGEFVFVSVVGYGESGLPARLTLKAKKADIDAASRGAITPDDFKKRVTSRVSVASPSSVGVVDGNVGPARAPRMSREPSPAGK